MHSVALLSSPCVKFLTPAHHALLVCRTAYIHEVRSELSALLLHIRMIRPLCPAPTGCRGRP